nr:unnamed protein product [Digitaria exilis]
MATSRSRGPNPTRHAREDQDSRRAEQITSAPPRRTRVSGSPLGSANDGASRISSSERANLTHIHRHRAEEEREAEHTYVCLEKEEGPAAEAAEAEDGERLLRKIMYASGSTTPAIMIAAPIRYLAGEGGGGGRFR